LLNLVINARDALREATVDRRQINIHARDDAGWVRLVVTDNGPGIAPEALAHLFQRFTTKGNAHHGLGLASAHASLQQFGGRIEGRNAPTGGAEFEVTLLAAPPSAPESPVSPRPPLRGARRTRPARILAVDDEPDILDIIRQHLDPLGHAVVLMTDPVQAIAEARSQAFDLVLCDVGLPKHSGLDVARWLREAGYRGKLVLMTGWDTEVLRTDGQEDMLLKKPFQGPDLLQVIDTLLGEWE
jgi:CheY-like chemotaxis protein